MERWQPQRPTAYFLGVAVGKFITPSSSATVAAAAPHRRCLCAPATDQASRRGWSSARRPSISRTGTQLRVLAAEGRLGHPGAPLSPCSDTGTRARASQDPGIASAASCEPALDGMERRHGVPSIVETRLWRRRFCLWTTPGVLELRAWTVPPQPFPLRSGPVCPGVISPVSMFHCVKKRPRHGAARLERPAATLRAACGLWAVAYSLQESYYYSVLPTALCSQGQDCSSKVNGTHGRGHNRSKCRRILLTHSRGL